MLTTKHLAMYGVNRTVPKPGLDFWLAQHHQVDASFMAFMTAI